MKTLIIIIFQSIIFFLQGYSQQSQVLVDSADFNFGYVPYQSTLNHTFWIYSYSEDTISVGEIKLGCGCLAHDIIRPLLLPNDSIPLSIAWETRKSFGLTRKSAYLYLSHSLDPIRLQFSAIIDTNLRLIEDIVSISPNQVIVKKDKSSNIQSFSITITNKTEFDRTIEFLSKLPENWIVELPEKLNSQKSVQVLIKIPKLYSNKDIPTTLTFETTESGTDIKRFSIPIFIEYSRKL